MELGLSLGDAAKPLEFLENRDKSRMKNGGLDFCMRLGIGIGIEERAKPPDNDDEDDDDDDVWEGDGSDDNHEKGETALQLHLNLVPLAPAASHLQFLPWSSDNGSSDNGSSGNTAAAAKGLDVNKPAAEEASSANSVGSPFHTELFTYRNKGHKKRDLEARGNDVPEAERASDDENNNNRKKLRLSKQQSAFLEESFKEHSTLNPKQKLALAKQLNLRPRQVEVWFQNRRARTKLKQTEVDCEYLKKCCETLTEENRKLHKELQELRALNTSNPFYMHRPATTLTMCPSCERVATAASSKSGGLSSEAATPRGKAFPPNRLKFFPFPQTPTHPDQPAAS